jgi:hypothetical protein
VPREARGVGPGRPKDVSTAGAIQAANQGIPPTPAGSTNIPTTRSPTSPAGASGRDPSRYGKPVTLDELFKKGGSVKSSASKRADGIAVKGQDPWKDGVIMGLRDIVGSLGIIPKMLARKDQEKSDEISRLRTENEKARRMAGAPMDTTAPQSIVTKKKGGMVKSSASKRADGIAKKGKTKGRFV